MRPLTTFLVLTAIITPLFFASAGVVTGDLQTTGGAAKFKVEGTNQYTISKIVGTIIRAFLGLLGTIFVVLMIYAGYLWMTAAGNEEEVTKAKKLITQAIMGLVVTMSSWAIYSFIIPIFQA